MALRAVQEEPEDGENAVHYDSLDDAIEAMDPKFLHCRDFGHLWKPFRANWNETYNYYETILRCTRCRTQRTRIVGPQGQLGGSSYAYAKGYQVKGLGPMTGASRDHLRLASIRHLLPKPRAVSDDS